jgi:hypothetical protein
LAAFARALCDDGNRWRPRFRVSHTTLVPPLRQEPDRKLAERISLVPLRFVAFSAITALAAFSAFFPP